MAAYDKQAGLKKLQKLQNSILRNERTARKNMQEFIEAGVLHTKETGDCSAIGRLFNALGKRPSLNVRSARLCIESLTSIRFVTQGKKGSKEIKTVLAKNEDGSAIKVTAAMVDAIRSADWADFQPAQEETIVTIEDLYNRVGNVVSLIDRLLKGEAKNQKLAPVDKQKAKQLRAAIKSAQGAVNVENFDSINDDELDEAMGPATATA